MFKLAPHQPPHPPSEPSAPCVDDDGRWDARVRGQATGQPRDERAAAAASAIAEAEASGVPPWGVVSVPPSVIGARPLATCGIDVRGGEGSAHETKRIWVRGLAAGSFLGRAERSRARMAPTRCGRGRRATSLLLVCREGPEPHGKGKEAQRISRLDDYEVTPVQRQRLRDVHAGKVRPLVSAKLKFVQAKVKEGVVGEMITKGLALDPLYNIWISSMVKASEMANQKGGGAVTWDELSKLERQKEEGGLKASIVGRATAQLSECRTQLNGLVFNRYQYTTFSRHFTAHHVLERIAERVQPFLRPTDTFIDFLLRDEHVRAAHAPERRRTTAPRALVRHLLADRADDRLPPPGVGSVDVAEHLPAGELVIGLNPPFGFRNGQALEFVEHSLCASPRMIVLIIPTTDRMLNYEPPGYETLIRDEELCRGNKFYTPGAEGTSGGSNNINTYRTRPIFVVWRRIAPDPKPRCRQCVHVVKEHRCSVSGRRSTTRAARAPASSRSGSRSRSPRGRPPTCASRVGEVRETTFESPPRALFATPISYVNLRALSPCPGLTSSDARDERAERRCDTFSLCFSRASCLRCATSFS